jgi:hypothetical protein
MLSSQKLFGKEIPQTSSFADEINKHFIENRCNKCKTTENVIGICPDIFACESHKELIVKANTCILCKSVGTVRLVRSTNGIPSIYTYSCSRCEQTFDLVGKDKIHF